MSPAEVQTEDPKAPAVSPALDDLEPHLFPMKVDTDLAELARIISERHAQAVGSAHAAVDHAIAAGEALLKAKARLLHRHGSWLPWLKDNVRDLSVRQAQAYMQVASMKNAPGAYLTLKAALKAVALRQAPKRDPQCPHGNPRANCQECCNHGLLPHLCIACRDNTSSGPRKSPRKMYSTAGGQGQAFMRFIVSKGFKEATRYFSDLTGLIEAKEELETLIENWRPQRRATA